MPEPTDLTTFDFKVAGLERSLAFTALLELGSGPHIAQPVEATDANITAFLQAYAQFLVDNGNTIIVGVTDMWSYAKGYVRQVGGYES